MRRVWVAVAVLTALVLHGAPAGAEEVAIDRGPATAIVPVLGDGGACSGVPDALPGIYDFTAPCERHDACYALGVDRLACDRAFREDLHVACQAQHPAATDPRRFLCLVFADLYFLGVRLFGGLAFAGSAA